MGRLTRDPDVRYSQGENSMAIARYSLAVDRRFNRGNDDNNTDFINIVAFGKAGEFAVNQPISKLQMVQLETLYLLDHILISLQR